MKAFTIDAENNITFHSSAKAAPKTEGIEIFTSEKALAEIAAAWPASRLVDIWNSLDGATPVKKLVSIRSFSVERISLISFAIVLRLRIDVIRFR